MMTMGNLKDIHAVVTAELKKSVALQPVTLKYPLPERPRRALGLVKIDGDVYTSEKFLRVVLLRVNFPVFLSVRTVFLLPRIEYDLPFFTFDAVFTGNRRAVVMDIHRTEEGRRREDAALIEKLSGIKDTYSYLFKKRMTQKTKIQKYFSQAVCRLKIPGQQDDGALALTRQYIETFLDLVDATPPMEGDALKKVQQDFEEYLITWADHDPGVVANKKLFGSQGGVSRGLDMFFGR